MPNPNPNRAWQKIKKANRLKSLMEMARSIPIKQLTLARVAEIERISTQAIRDYYPEVIELINQRKKKDGGFSKINETAPPSL